MSLDEGRNKALRRMLGNSVVQDDHSAKERTKSGQACRTMLRDPGICCYLLKTRIPVENEV